MYFKFFNPKSWVKRSAGNRRRFVQRLLKISIEKGLMHSLQQPFG